MAKRRTYPLAYRQRMVELVQAGRTPEELAREFEPSAAAIRKWVGRRSWKAGPGRMA